VRALLAALVLAVIAAPAGSAPRTMRLDYVHLGNAETEHFALDELVLEGEWPGPEDRRLDHTNLGKYFFEVVDDATNRVLYSRGFASIYGEWETTGEAHRRNRSFHESLRFPAPEAPAHVVLKKRGSGGGFHEIWSTPIDPADPTIDRTGPGDRHRVWPVMQNGPPRDKVDLLLLGDGYTSDEMEKWHADAERMVETLFAVSPFRERRQDFNVWAIDSPSERSGVARSSDGVHRRSALQAKYDAFGSERYVLTFDNKRWREVAAAAPYEFVEIIMNDRKYGGGGIFNLYATVASENAFTPYVFVHEFGHHFAGLADEYYTSSTAYEGPIDRPEPWEPNATADPRAVKWSDLIGPDTPLPTPWAKQAFEDAQSEIQAERRAIRAEGRPESEMEALFLRERDQMTRLLGDGEHASAVGAFEGANYQAQGYYRPQADCIMFTRDEVGFCAVCRRAIERVIDLYAAAGR